MEEKKSRYRCLQFSLRSFLLFVTAFAVWLGLCVDRAHRQAAAVKAIRSSGGQSFCDYQLFQWNLFFFDGEQVRLPTFKVEATPNSWMLGRRLLGDDLFDETVWASVDARLPGDDLMNRMSDLRYLRHLVIDGRGGNGGIPGIGTLRYLESLRLRGTDVSKTDALCIARLPRLKELDLRNSCVGDDGLRELSTAAGIEWLILAALAPRTMDHRTCDDYQGSSL